MITENNWESMSQKVDEKLTYLKDRRCTYSSKFGEKMVKTDRDVSTAAQDSNLSDLIWQLLLLQ